MCMLLLEIVAYYCMVLGGGHTYKILEVTLITDVYRYDLLYYLGCKLLGFGLFKHAIPPLYRSKLSTFL